MVSHLPCFRVGQDRLIEKRRDTLVTGGGTGLGLVTATTLARNGCTVYITGRRGDVLEKAAKSIQPKNGKGKVVAIQADVSTKEGINSGSDLV